MPTNINAIARTSSGRLADILSANLADSIVKERELNGDFSSFEDLQKRIRGLGPVKINKLKEAGFVVAPTAREAKSVKDAETGEIPTHEESQILAVCKIHAVPM